MNALTPHLAILSVLTTGIGAAMIRMAIGRGLLAARQEERRCPSCGRLIRVRVCRACTSS
jgi:ABC-type branched-subunit amino acid transport system permease subunit